MDYSEIENYEKMYAFSMHAQLRGKLNDKCSKCGMDFTEPVQRKRNKINGQVLGRNFKFTLL